MATGKKDALFIAFAERLFGVPPAHAERAAARLHETPDSAIGDLLVADGSLSEADCHVLQIIVDDVLKCYDGDAEAAMSSLGGEATGYTATLHDPSTGDFTEALVGETPGRYTVKSEYAHGGIGRILLVHDRVLGRDVALKELLQRFQTKDGTDAPVRIAAPAMRRFLQEARVTSQLEHPSIVPVYELGQRRDGTPYYTMRFIKGRTLADAIAQAGDIRSRLDLLPHFVDLCQALAYAHSRGVVHRDVKPVNVLVGTFGETVVIDWGLAKVKKDPASERQAEWQAVALGAPDEVEGTRIGQILGTPHYMAPEQALGRTDEVDELSDVYALGAVLYELLTGKRPYGGKTTSEVIEQVIHTQPSRVLELAPETPADLAAICERAMAREKHERYESVKALIDELRRFQSGAMVQAHDYTVGERLSRFVNRYRMPLALAAAALALLAAVGAFYNVRLVQSHRQLESTNAELLRENYVGQIGLARQAVTDRLRDQAVEVLAATPPNLRHFEWGFLQLRAKPELLRITKNDTPPEVYGMIINTACSPDGRLILSHHHFSGVKAIFELQTGKYRFGKELSPALGWPACVAFAPDSRSFYGPIDIHTVGRWSAKTGEERAVFHDPSYELVSVAPSPDNAHVAIYGLRESGEGQVIVWATDGGEPVARFDTAHVDEPFVKWERHDRFFSPVRGKLLGYADEQTLVYRDTHLSVLDVSTGAVRQITPVGTAATLASEAPVAAIVDNNNQLTVWDVYSGQHLYTVPGGFDPAANLLLRPDGARVFTGVDPMKVWDTATGALLYELDNPGFLVTMSANGQVLCGRGNDSLHLLDATGPRSAQVASFHDSTGAVRSEDFQLDFGVPPTYSYSPDRTRLAVGAKDGIIRLYRTSDFELTQTWKAHDVRLNTIDFSTDGTMIATAGTDAAKVWNAATGDLLIDVPPDGAPETLCAAFSPDGAWLAVGGGDGSDGRDKWRNQARVIDLATGELVYRVAGHIGSIRLVDFSLDGKWLLTGGYGAVAVKDDPSINIWDAATGTQLMGSVNAINWPWHVTFTPDNSRMLALGLGLVPVMYNLNEMREEYRLDGLRAIQAFLHPDGKRFGVVHENQHLLIFDASDGRQLLNAGQGGIPATFSPDGKTLLSARDGQHMQRWFAQDWTLPAPLDPIAHDSETVFNLMQEVPEWREQGAR